MTTHAAMIAVPGARGELWAVLRNVVAWPMLLPTITSVSALGEGPLAVGQRYRVVRGRLGTAVWTVDTVDPVRGFAWTARIPCLEMRREYEMDRIDDRTQRLTLRLTSTGSLSDLAATGARDLLREAQAFKRIMAAFGRWHTVRTRDVRLRERCDEKSA